MKAVIKENKYQVESLESFLNRGGKIEIVDFSNAYENRSKFGRTKISVKNSAQNFKKDLCKKKN